MQDDASFAFVNEATATCFLNSPGRTSARTKLRADGVVCTALTIATFDLKGNRTGYYPNVIAILLQDHSGLMLFDVEGLNKINIQSIISDYLINKSGSVVFRLKNFLYETLDIEVKTIKTLGYEDKINNRHVRGDVDMRGM